MGPLETLEALGQHAAEQLEPIASERSNHETLRAQVARRVVGPKSSRFRSMVALGVAAIACAATLGVVVLEKGHNDLRYFVGNTEAPAKVGTWLSSTDAMSLPIRFSDGTRVSLWPEGRGRVTRLSATGADLVLERGRASLDVVRRPGNHWQVSTGPFVVQVTGTRFLVEWYPEKDAFALELYEGHVRLLGCAFGDGQDINSGERVEASCSHREFRVSALAEKTRDARPTTLPQPVRDEPLPAPSAGKGALQARVPGDDPDHKLPSGSPVSERQGPPQHPSWSRLARHGRFADAYDAAVASGFEAECANRSAEDLLLLGDAARLTGHLDRARQAYDATRNRFAGTSSAALAAFQMGRAELDQRGDYASAERWLNAYLAEEPSGTLVAPAMGRLMEAEARLGRADLARTIAQRYLDRFPNGAHGGAARRLLGLVPVDGDH